MENVILASGVNGDPLLAPLTLINLVNFSVVTFSKSLSVGKMMKIHSCSPLSSTKDTILLEFWE